MRRLSASSVSQHGGSQPRRLTASQPSMRAIEISSFGGPDVLRLVDRPDPQPAAGEVLIRVDAAGVNRPDLMQRQGHYPPPKGASVIRRVWNSPRDCRARRSG